MSKERWRSIGTAPDDTDENKPILLSDGEQVWLGYWEPNGRYLYPAGEGGWTDGRPGHWNEQLVCRLRPTHWKPSPRPSPKPRRKDS